MLCMKVLWNLLPQLVFYTFFNFENTFWFLVERLLNETDIYVAAYTGQLDLIVDMLGKY